MSVQVHIQSVYLLSKSVVYLQLNPFSAVTDYRRQNLTLESDVYQAVQI